MSGFLAWQSAVSFRALLEVQPASWALATFVAWAFSLMVTGVFAFLVFVLPAHRLLPDAYYRVRAPGRLRTVYRALGVGAFRRVLLATLWRDRARQSRFFDGSAADLDGLAERSRAAEFGHAVPFALLCGASAVWVARGAVRLGLLTLAVNVLGNLYPVLLQRHHRMRIGRLRRVRSQRERRAPPKLDRAG